MFDYDDTLAWNQHDYSFAQLRLIEWAIARLGHKCPDVQQIINLQVGIDKELVKTMGFVMERFPRSFKLTYRKLCERVGVTDEFGSEEAYRIGTSAFDAVRWKQQGLVDGASETLDFLVQQGDELMIFTKGDYRVQNQKIEATNCKKWFGENIFIILDKTVDCINTVVGHRNKFHVWMVGNLMKSDIVPALEAEIGAIYIPCETWAYERDGTSIAKSDRLITFDRIIDIKNNYVKIK